MTVNKNMRFGKLLRIKRVEEDLMLKEVAESLGVNPNSLLYLETKQENTLIVRYLKYFYDRGIDINDFFKNNEL